MPQVHGCRELASHDSESRRDDGILALEVQLLADISAVASISLQVVAAEVIPQLFQKGLQRSFHPFVISRERSEF